MIINNNNFLLLNKVIHFIIKLDVYKNNISKEDIRIKDDINETVCLISKNIIYINNNNNFKRYNLGLSKEIYYLNILLETMYLNKYISENELENLVKEVTEINKIRNVWTGKKI